MRNSTVLVTGNLGYIGPILGKYLKKKYPYMKLIGLDNAYFQANLLSPNISYDHYYDTQFYGDLRYFDFRILPPVDYIISLGAISNDPMGNIFEAVTYDINFKSTINLAKFAKNHGVKRFIFASSCSVYGAGGADSKNEYSPLNPLTPYAKSKIMSEEILEKLSDTSFNVTCLRFATACGASPRLRLDLVLNDFVSSALLFNKIEILSDGTPWRPLININDMCKAVEWSLIRDSEILNFLSINIGSNDWNFQIKDLAYSVKNILNNQTQVSINSEAQPDKRSYKVDFTLFEKLAPQFTPTESLESTIRDITSSLVNSGFNNKYFRDSHLIRLKSLENLRVNEMIDKSLVWS